MNASVVRRVMDAVGNRILPVRPGDMLFFNITKERLFIVCCSEQEPHPTEGQRGQRIAGIRGGNGKYQWVDTWLNWDGYSALWTIHRTT